MVLSRRVAWFLVAFGVWSWIIWPTFLKNIWNDPRSWHHGMTGFFGVHLALTIASLILGTAIGGLGVRGLVIARRRSATTQRADRHGDQNAASSGRGGDPSELEGATQLPGDRRRV